MRRFAFGSGILFVLLSLVVGCGVGPGALEVALSGDAEGASTASLDFGRAAAGERVDRTVFVRNAGESALTLEHFDWVKDAPAFFAAEPLPVGLELAVGGQAGLKLAFQPEVPSNYVGTLRMRARDPEGRVSEGTLQLLGVAHAAPLPVEPIAVLSPADRLQMGEVPFIEALAGTPGGRQVEVRRKLRLFNAGHRDSLLHVREIRHAAIAGTTAGDGELVVGLPLDWDLDAGIPARVGENALELEVIVRPASIGAKGWTLTLVTDDPNNPEVSVEVTAQAELPEPCELQMPERINLGLGASPPDHRDVPVQIANVARTPTEVCVLWDFGIAEGSSPGISLRSPPPEPVVLWPDESVELVVRLQPPDAAELSGWLQFRTSSAPDGWQRIAIAARRDPVSCLTVAPDALDYGDVGVGCASATRTFSVYNTCSTPVTVTGFGIVDAAGQGAGGPQCPGTQACPEFILMQAPPVPPSGLTLQPGAGPLTFQVRYRPIDGGPDLGSVRVEAHAGSRDQGVTVQVRGRGERLNRHTDVFTIPLPPKRDFLLVIDDSASMAPHAAHVTQNLAWLRDELMKGHIDFQFAALSADVAKGTGLRTGPSHPDAVLTPASLGFASQFDARVAVGTTGGATQSCLEQAVGALEDPANVALGFRRPDAQLDVLCVTASPDASPRTATQYRFALLGPVPRPQEVNFSVFGPVTAACPGDSGILVDVATLTWGLREPICGFHFGGLFFWGGIPSPGGFLTGVPDLQQGPVTVRVDGVPVPPEDAEGRTVWAYDPISQMVTFEPLHQPGPGSTIEITYYAACYP